MKGDEAISLIKSGLGKAELQLVARFVAPFFWVSTDKDQKKIRSASIFFLDCGRGSFAVTAAHVLTAYLRTKATPERFACQISDLPIDPGERCIECDDRIDIATLRISKCELDRINKSVLTGWPPVPPEVGGGVLFAGFPERERLVESANLNFGTYAACTVADSVNDRVISCQFSRECWIDTMGLGLPSLDYDLSGLSGSPMLTIVERKGLRYYRLGGVIFSGPEKGGIEGFALVRARRAEFILPDGTLDKFRWI